MRSPLRKGLPVAALAWLLGVPTAMAAPPPIQPGERPVPGSTEAELWYGMDRAERDIAASPIRIRDKQLVAYVQRVLCEVTAASCPDLRLYIVDVPQFNAQMAPNGMVLVFTGALLRMHDEAELAIVLGHEFTHYRLRHGLQFWIKARHTSAVFASLGVGGGLVGGLAQVVGMASLFSYSRDFEREADREGFAAALAHGYDPQAGVRLWARMLREEKASRERHYTVFASHPKTAERLQDVRAAAAAAPAGTWHDGRAVYQQAVRPLLPHWLDEELSRRTYDASIQVITDLRADAPADEQGLLAFYLAQAYRQRRAVGDAERASALYREAIAHADAPADAWREYGLDLRQAGQRAGAIAALQRYLQLAPQAQDRAFIEQDLAELEKAP